MPPWRRVSTAARSNRSTSPGARLPMELRSAGHWVRGAPALAVQGDQQRFDLTGGGGRDDPIQVLGGEVPMLKRPVGGSGRLLACA